MKCVLNIRKFQTHLGFVNEHRKVLFQSMCLVIILGSRSLPAQETILKWDNIGTYL